jgi:hypothetical protein
MTERGLWLTDPAQRGELAVFLRRALRLDDAAVVRLRLRADGLLGAWVATGFEVLASRAVAGRMAPDDLTCAADVLLAGLAAPGPSGHVDPGFALDSAWRGALPPETGFVHLEDVPAGEFDLLARRGADLAREHAGPHGPPASLLDQQVLAVRVGPDAVEVPMRCVLALAAMGFLGEPGRERGGSEVLRVRAAASWLRIDAPFGSVFRRRGGPALLVVSDAERGT